MIAICFMQDSYSLRIKAINHGAERAGICQKNVHDEEIELFLPWDLASSAAFTADIGNTPPIPIPKKKRQYMIIEYISSGLPEGRTAERIAEIVARLKVIAKPLLRPRESPRNPIVSWPKTAPTKMTALLWR